MRRYGSSLRARASSPSSASAPFRPYLGILPPITSATGAAIQIFMRGRRWPAAQLTLLPTAVQGEAGAGEIIAAFDRLRRWWRRGSQRRTDPRHYGRGGGSSLGRPMGVQ